MQTAVAPCQHHIHCRSPKGREAILEGVNAAGIEAVGNEEENDDDQPEVG